MKLFSRAEQAPHAVIERAGLPRGERVLAFAQDGDRWLLGTRLALVVLDDDVTRIGWESVQAADWDDDTSTLRVSEVGEFGQERPIRRFTLTDPILLLQLVRERVTASVVLQRGFLTDGKRGFKVIGRRSPDGGPISWMHDYDEGVDPEDPAVAEAAAAVLAQARADVGE